MLLLERKISPELYWKYKHFSPKVWYVCLLGIILCIFSSFALQEQGNMAKICLSLLFWLFMLVAIGNQFLRWRWRRFPEVRLEKLGDVEFYKKYYEICRMNIDNNDALYDLYTMLIANAYRKMGYFKRAFEIADGIDYRHINLEGRGMYYSFCLGYMENCMDKEGIVSLSNYLKSVLDYMDNRHCSYEIYESCNHVYLNTKIVLSAMSGDQKGFDEAEKEIKKLGRKQGNSIWILYEKGCLAQALGKVDEARTYFKNVVEKGVTADFTEPAKSRLDALSSGQIQETPLHRSVNIAWRKNIYDFE